MHLNDETSLSIPELTNAHGQASWTPPIPAAGEGIEIFPQSAQVERVGNVQERLIEGP